TACVVFSRLFILCCLFIVFALTEIYTLSLHDALPIWNGDALPLLRRDARVKLQVGQPADRLQRAGVAGHGEPPSVRTEEVAPVRSEEHTSELQSLAYLVCRLLLEKKNNKNISTYDYTT